MASSHSNNQVSKTNNGGNISVGNILDIIREKASNIEQVVQQKSFKESIDDAIKMIAKREKITRESTITIRQDEHLRHEDIISIIEEKWTNANGSDNLTFWQDKEASYCQFTDKVTKTKFLAETLEGSWPKNDKEAKFRQNIRGLLDSNQPNYSRKPARLEISMVKASIKTDSLKIILEKQFQGITSIAGFREGKPHSMNKSRSIFFQMNAKGIEYLYDHMDGVISYVNKPTNIRAKLFPKINAKPWQCRECLAFGQHQCQGKTCNQCGNKGHETKECSQKTKYCNNCRKKGHKAKDTHCPIYISETIKELRKMDIPIKFLDSKKPRAVLINNLQIR